MDQIRAFASSVAAAARDMTKDFQNSSDGRGVFTGRQYRIGNRVLQEERLLSEGGYGFVFLVRDINSGEYFVVKRMLCQDRERLELAQREIEILEKIPVHPNLVRYYGHAIERTDSKGKEVMLLMEYCTGGHLYDLMLKRNGRVSKEDVLKILADVSSALLALHSMSPPVQHRDLKLENVLMNSSGNFVLVDFGSWSSEAPDLSQLARDELMKFGETVERYTTLMYRPPEMADLYKGFPISGKVDVWMLGCILFTLLNNKHPFQNASTLAIVNCRYSFDLDECKRFPAKLVELCSWCLAQNPVDRPSPSQLIELLKNWDEAEPLPLPQSVVDRIEKDARLYGIPSMTRRASTKENKTKHAGPLVDGGWTNPEESKQTWKADFSGEDLLQIDDTQRRPSAESLPDLLG
jgi:AP2-associated kinase